MVVALTACLLPGLAAAQVRATLDWDPNTDGVTAGYSVSVGTSPGAPTATINVGLSTRAVLTLALGARYYATVRGYAANGTSGPASAETEIDLVAVPDRPSRVTANVNGSIADVSWAAPTSGPAALSYRLSVGTSPGSSNLLNGLAVGTATNVNGALPPGVYYARVQASNLVGTGLASAEVAFQVGGAGAAPGSPTGLSVAWSGANAHLSWTAPAGEAPSSYVIEAGTRSGSTDVGAFDVGNTTSYLVAGLPNVAYHVRVRATNARGSSLASNEILLQRSTVAPPGRVDVLEAENRGGTVLLDWEAPTSGGPVQGYVLEAGTAPGLSDIATVKLGNVRIFTATVPAGVYFIRVRAVNDGGLGAPSRDAIIRQ